MAEELCVEMDTAGRLMKDGQAMHAAVRDLAPYVEVVGTASQPAVLTSAQSVKHTPAQRAAELPLHGLLVELAVRAFFEFAAEEPASFKMLFRSEWAAPSRSGVAL